MSDQWELWAEAAKRGLLDPDKKVFYDEAQRRGLVPSATIAGPPSVPGGMDGEIPSHNIPVAKNEPRLGDALKPVFGGHNPVAETYDVATKALDPSSDRPLTTRAKDTAAFLASAPLQMFRAPSIGDIAEKNFGFSDIKRAEEGFVENNPDLLYGLNAVGTAAAYGGPSGQGFRMPVRPAQPSPTPKNDARVADDVGRARRAADTMREVGVTPYGPAVAMAKRGDDTAGGFTQTFHDKPIIGTPLQRGTNRYIDETIAAFDDARNNYGRDADIQTAGGRIKAAVNENRSVRDIDVKALPDDQLRALARRTVRSEGYRDVQSAKYELAERLLPEGKLGRKSVGVGETRDLALPGHTQKVLLQIKDRKGQTINKSSGATGKGGSLRTGDLDFQNPSWTNNRDLNASLDLLATNPNWRTGIQGIREIRSMVRRTKAGMKGDNEVRALAKGDLKRLEGSLTDDLYGLFERVIKDEVDAGRADVASRYQAAFNAMKDADGFTRTYEKNVFGPLKRILHEDITPGNAAAEIMTAMKDGTRGNLERLTALSRAVPREVIDDFGSAILKEMARPLKGAHGAIQESGVQLSKLVSSWNELNPRARRIIFGRDPAKLARLEKIIGIAENLKDFERLANNSRTGVSNMVAATIAAGGAGLSAMSPGLMGIVAMTLIGGRSISWFMASPAYVNWLTRAGVLSRNGSPTAIAAHLRSLKRLMADNAILAPQEAQAVAMAIAEADRAEAEAGPSMGRRLLNAIR